MSAMRILPAGDRAMVVEFGNKIDPDINHQVLALSRKLALESVPGILDLVPTFRSLLIHYEPSLLEYASLRQIVQRLGTGPGPAVKERQRILHIPCCYGSHFGPDLTDMARYTKLTRDEIIALHSGVDYKIYMLGFLPGFVYLGGLDKRLEMPRLSTPRLRIPQGSVGIGGRQTGVYPLDSPGGWRLIGATPIDFYQPDQEEPVLCRAGDFIRFEPISSSDYYDIRQMQQKGTYPLNISETYMEGSD